MKKTMLLLGLAMTLISCNKERITDISSEDSWFKYPIKVTCEESDGAAKSSWAGECLGMITDLNTAIYLDGKLVMQEYFTDLSKIVLSFPDEKKDYDIFFLANCGELTVPVSESAMQKLACHFTDYEGFKDKGVPMSLQCNNFKPGERDRFTLKRLTGEYDISFSDSSGRNDYRITSVCLCNCAKDVHPFMEESKAESVFDIGDFLTEEDISLLNSGKTVKLFFLENMQGTLLAGNTDPMKKIPSSIGDNSVSGVCTYLLVAAQATTPTAEYGNIYCRCFLGENTTDNFDVRRNTVYHLNLDFASDFISEQEWRLEADDPEITGKFSISKKSIYLFKGYEHLDGNVYVSVPEGAEYTVETDLTENKEAKVSFSTSVPSRTVDGKRVYSGSGEFRFETGLEPDACLQFGKSPDLKHLNVTFTSTDGLLQEHLSVNVFHELFPVRFEYINDMIQMKTFNPFALPFNTNIRGEVWGSATGQESQIKGERYYAFRDYFGPVQKQFVPVSNHWHNIDDSVFYGSCHNIRYEHDVWYDHTWLGTSGNWRHSELMEYTIDLDLEIAGKTPDIIDPIGSGEMFWMENIPNVTDGSTEDVIDIIWSWEYIGKDPAKWDDDLNAILDRIRTDRNFKIMQDSSYCSYNHFLHIWPSGIDMKCHFKYENGTIADFHSENTDTSYDYWCVRGGGYYEHNRTITLSINGRCDWFWNFRDRTDGAPGKSAIRNLAFTTTGSKGLDSSEMIDLKNKGFLVAGKTAGEKEFSFIENAFYNQTKDCFCTFEKHSLKSGCDMNFYAVHPCGTNMEVTDDGIVSRIERKNLGDDILAAETDGVKYDFLRMGGDVPLRFRHILGKLVLSVKGLSENTEYTLDKLTVKSCESGTYNFNGDCWKLDERISEFTFVDKPIMVEGSSPSHCGCGTFLPSDIVIDAEWTGRHNGIETARYCSSTGKINLNMGKTTAVTLILSDDGSRENSFEVSILPWKTTVSEIEFQ